MTVLRAVAPCVLVLAAGCARPPVALECIDQAEFEARLIEIQCRNAAVCGWLGDRTEAECVAEVGEYAFREGNWWIGEACPDARYDPCEAAGWLDHAEHSPIACGEREGAGGLFDWYHDACGWVYGAV
jgi:hypothetical protein